MLSAQAKSEILELFARFAHCSDYGDWAGMEPLFAPDVVTDFADYDFRYEGVAAQVEDAKEQCLTGLAKPPNMRSAGILSVR
jgi:hypothetical protein